MAELEEDGATRPQHGRELGGDTAGPPSSRTRPSVSMRLRRRQWVSSWTRLRARWIAGVVELGGGRARAALGDGHRRVRAGAAELDDWISLWPVPVGKDQVGHFFQLSPHLNL